MAWIDNPQVDTNSKRSEESELTIRALFTRKNRFLTRTESPDYGVDLVIELMDDNDQVNAFQFAVQIKSSFTSPLIKNDTFISIPFKTSRLGYLCRRKPGLGIIIFYDESAKTAFFEYVETIVDRLSDERPNEDWKLQEDVNIYIPFRNILNENQVSNIYQKMYLRSQNHATMWITEGKKYDLPLSSNNSSNAELDESFINEFEEMGGALLINEQRFSDIHYILSGIKKDRILISPQLLFYGVVAYCELGDIIEAQYYLKRCKQNREKLNDFERELIEMLTPKISFLAGDIEIEELIRRLKIILNSISDPLNETNLKVALLTLEVVSGLDEQKDLLLKFQPYFESIDKLDISDIGKYQLQLNMCEAIGNFTIKIFSKLQEDLQMKERLGVNKETPKTIFRLSQVQRLISFHDDVIETILKYATKNSNDLLKAFSILRRGNFFMQLQFNIAAYQVPCKVDDLINFFRNNYNQLIWSFNILIQKNLYREAQLVLGNAIELQDIFEFSFPNEIRIDFYSKDELIKRIKNIEVQSAIKPFEFHAKKFLEQHKSLRDRREPFNTKMLTDKEIEQLALKALAAYEIPKERIPNIIAELKAYQKFEQFNKNPDIILTIKPHHLMNKSTTYLYPTIFVLRSKKTGFQSNSSSDIDELLTEFKYLMQAP
jgi:Domain of unknown function (DUF4365)